MASPRLLPQQRRRGSAGAQNRRLRKAESIDTTATTTATSTSNSTKRGRMGAAVLLVAFGAMLVGGGGGGGRFGRSSAKLTGNLRFSRKLTASAAAAADARKLVAEKVSPSLVETVHRLADPFLAGESSIFAFDDTDPRPVVNTFFAIRDGQTISRADAETLAVWRRAWDGFGWNPVSRVNLAG